MSIVNKEGPSNVFIMKELNKSKLWKHWNKCMTLSQLIDCQWVDIFKSAIWDGDSDGENIPLPCAGVTKSTTVAIVIGDHDF